MRSIFVFLASITMALLARSSPSQGPVPLPSTKQVIDRMDAIAAAETDILMKTVMKAIAADLRRGCQQGKIRRDWGPGGLGPNIPGNTTGEDGIAGTPLLPGWGPKQILYLGGEALQLYAWNLCRRCVANGPMKQADKDCLLKDVTLLTLVHEWVHLHQRTPVPFDPKDEQMRALIECEAYGVQCLLAFWIMTEVPKYGVLPGVPQLGCTLGRLMLMEYRTCKKIEVLLCN